MANRIKELRESFEMKQIDLATFLNVSQGTLSNWERCVHDPDNETLIILAEKFNVSVDYLLRKTNNTSSFNPHENSHITDSDLKFALFGRTDIDDKSLNAVKKFARFVNKDEEDD